jgi:hypothetical protein
VEEKTQRKEPTMTIELGKRLEAAAAKLDNLRAYL